MNKRLLYSLILCFIPDSGKRTRWLRKHNVFAHIGQKSIIRSRLIPLYPELITLGDNVRFASNVHLITHDVCHMMLNNDPDFEGTKFREKKGPIVFGNNVFVGANTTVLYDVTVGDNVIIGANSLVNKDVPSNSVVGGVPAKVIGSFEDFVEKRKILEQ